MQSLFHTYQRYRTLQTGVISALPLVILMPHSACNCRCVMCDIWKDNKNLKQLTEADVSGLIGSLKKLGTRMVAMSGGEALLNANFFKLCEILKREGIGISLMSTGLSLKRHVEQLDKWVDEVIVSVDGDEDTHDMIRNIDGAFEKLREGVLALKCYNPMYRITGRTVIHRLNFRNWEAIIDEAKGMGLNQLSFLPADVSSHAFNRQQAWAEPRQHEILLDENELTELHDLTECLINRHEADFASGYIAESPAKIRQIYEYYAAFYGFNPFPFKKCNAPWVSMVVEADGSVRPCFFHKVIGNIRDESLFSILNKPEALDFRRALDMSTNPVCVKCVCSLNLPPRVDPAVHFH